MALPNCGLALILLIWAVIVVTTPTGLKGTVFVTFDAIPADIPVESVIVTTVAGCPASCCSRASASRLEKNA